MKRTSILCFIMISLILSSLCGCGKENKQTQSIKIAALNGPTGMGMAQLMDQKKEQYEVTLYQSADDIVGKIVTGEIDIACVPSNLAAVLYKKTDKNIYLLGTNTLGTLYIVENGNQITTLEDLRGKTIIASGQGSTPEYVLDQLLLGQGIDPSKDVTIEFLGNHTDVVTKLVATKDVIALLPQPHVTIAKAKDDNVRIALDLNQTWESQLHTQLPMGVIIANKEFVDAHQEEIEAFLKDYAYSVKFVNDYIDEAATIMVQQEILISEEIAKAAIPYCHIVFIDGKASKEALEQFYTILQEINPSAIGGALPDDTFYYQK